MTIAEVTALVERSQRQLQDREAQLHLLRQQQAQLLQQLATSQESARQLEHTLIVLQQFSEALRAECIEKFEKLVTMGLQVVFEAPYEFRIETEIQRSVVGMRFLLVEPTSDGPQERELYDAISGGFIDVVSFLLRVMVLVLMRPRQRRLLLLDECFAHVSQGYKANVALLLQRLSQRLDLQILLVTHAPELGDHADKVYTITKTDQGTVAH